MEKYVQSSTWGPDTGIIKNNKQGWKRNAAVKSKYRVTIEDILSDLYQTFACFTNVVLLHSHRFSRHLRSCKQKSAVSLCHMDAPHVFP